MLDRRAISMYRRFLFDDAESTKPIPESLKALHLRFWELLGPKKGVNRSQLTTETLVTCVIVWEQTTAEGSLHAQKQGRMPLLPISGGFAGDRPVMEGMAVDWFKVKPGTDVFVRTRRGVQEKKYVTICKDGRLRVSYPGPDGKTHYATFSRTQVSLVTAKEAG